MAIRVVTSPRRKISGPFLGHRQENAQPVLVVHGAQQALRPGTVPMRARQVSLRSVRQTQCEGRFGRLHPWMSHAFTARLPAERTVLRQQLVSIR